MVKILILIGNLGEHNDTTFCVAQCKMRFGNWLCLASFGFMYKVLHQDQLKMISAMLN